MKIKIDNLREKNISWRNYMKFEHIPITKIDLDKDNPRIGHFDGANKAYDSDSEQQAWLESILLQPHGSEEYGPDAEELQKSIRAAGTIIEPIILIKNSDRYVCIEGNTRLAIYRKFSDDANISQENNWDSIPALVYENMDKSLIDNLRLQAHFVGKKEWTPYSKGLFIHKLLHAGRQVEDIKKIVGGSDSKITANLEAFHMFQEHFVPLFSPEKDGINPPKKRFTQFAEYCSRSSIRAALEDHAGSEKKARDIFSKWVRDEKIGQIRDVRKIPDILSNKDAKEAFLKGKESVAEVAAQYLSTSNKTPLNNSTLADLAEELGDRLSIINKHKKNLSEKDLSGLDYLSIELGIFLDSKED